MQDKIVCKKQKEICALISKCSLSADKEAQFFCVSALFLLGVNIKKNDSPAEPNEVFLIPEVMCQLLYMMKRMLMCI